jgi:hypothetical protein
MHIACHSWKYFDVGAEIAERARRETAEAPRNDFSHEYCICRRDQLDARNQLERASAQPSAFYAPPPVTYADPQGTCAARTTYLFAPGQLHLLTYIARHRGSYIFYHNPSANIPLCHFSGSVHKILEKLLLS